MIVGGSINLISRDKSIGLKERFILRVFLLLTCNLIAPVLATLFIDRQCFYDFIVPIEPIDLFYEYPVCDLPANDGRSCLQWKPTISIQKIFPPFIYTNQCASAVMQNYIPPIIFYYSLLGLLIPVGALLSLFYVPSFKVFPMIKLLFPGILFPDTAHLFNTFFKATTLIASTLVHICMMLTFGLSSFTVTVAIVLVSMSELYITELFIGRYFLALSRVKVSEHVREERMESIESELFSVWRLPKSSIWLTVAISCGFIGMSLLFE